MNILEAIAAVKAGECIRYVDVDDNVFFCFQTTLQPIGKKELVTVSKNSFMRDLDEDTKYPALEDLDLDDLDSVCLHAILNETFQKTSIDEMLQELREAWDKFHDELEEDDEDEDD